MAAPTHIYLVYATADGKIVDGSQPTQALATAAAGTGQQTAQIAINDVPIWFGVGGLLGYYRNNAIHQGPALTAVDQAKLIASVQRDRIIGFCHALAAEEHFFPPEDAAIARPYLAWLHWGNYGVWRSATIALATKISWGLQSARGTSDLNSGADPITVEQVRQFFPIVRGWNETERTARTPNAPLLTCSPVSPHDRNTLENMRTNSAQAQELATATTAAEFTKIANGSYIDDITA
ncbi:MAG: hypothetical protein F4X59_17480 [Holophagales bacterium]|nr:hypothetical protein [Holophagales bacterium]MYC11898.1 hypothetical protein [Holophagales bacterium]